MSQTLSNVLIHFVYSTKHRQTWLKDQQVRHEMYSIMGKILQDFDCHPILISGVEDHVHVLCDFTRNYTIKKVVSELKTGPSKWIKTQGATYQDFQWQSGYGAFSVSQSRKPELVDCIQNQEEHHRKWSFQDEVRWLCQLHEVAIDERYIWD
jgi:putative transposase